LITNEGIPNLAGAFAPEETTESAFLYPNPDQQPEVNPKAALRQGQIASLALDTEDEIMNSLAARSEIYARTIEQAGESTLRNDAVYQQQERTLRAIQSLPDYVPPETLRDLAVDNQQLASEELARDTERRKRVALEQEAVSKVMDLAERNDYTQATLLYNNLIFGGPEQRMRDINAKRLILSRAIEKAQIDLDSQPWYSHVLDWLLFTVPFNSPLSNNDNVVVADGMKRWYDWLFSGVRKKTEGAVLMSMPIEDFAEYVDKQLIPNVLENSTLFGYNNNTEELNLLSSFSDMPTPLETNLWDTLDTATFVPWTRLGKGAKGLVGVAARTGARKEAGELLAGSIRASEDLGVARGAETLGVDADDVVESLLPTVVNPGRPPTELPLAREAELALERGDRVLRERFAASGVERLEPTELEKAISVQKERLNRIYEDRVVDVSAPITRELADGARLRSTDVTLGNRKGRLFTRKRDAEGYATSIGYDVKHVIKDAGGGWAVKINVPVSEMGFFTKLLEPVAKTAFGRYILRSSLVEDKLTSAMSLLAGQRKAQIKKALMDEYAKEMNSLGSAERQTLAQIVAKGADEEIWLTYDEFDVLHQRLTDQPASQKLWNAYHKAIEINDVEYTMRNLDIYKQRYVQGMETGTISLADGTRIERANMFIDRDMSKPKPGERVFVADEARHYTNSRPLSQVDFDRYKSEGYFNVTLQDAVTLKDGTTVKNLFVKGNDLNIESLRLDQVPYKAGFHRMYTEQYFAKQAVWGIQPDTKVKFLKNPGTYRVGTKAEMDFWSERMEMARRLYNEKNGKPDPDEIDKIFAGHKGFESGDDFIKNMDDGVYQKDTPFGTYFDRQMPEEYILNPEAAEFVDLEEGGFNGFLRTNNRMYYSGKGERLHDWEGQAAPVLDVYETINRSLANIANLSSWSDYKVSSVERWVNTYGKYLNRESIPSDASNYWIFMNAEPSANINKLRGGDIILNQMQAQRDIIKRNLGWKSPATLKFEQQTRRFIEWVEGGDPTNLTRKNAARMANWINESNPLMAIRGFAFDLKLGLFNVAQWPLQIQTAVAATTLSPRAGWQGMTAAPFMMLYRTKAGSENMLTEFVKRGLHTATGFSEPKEFKQFMRMAKNNGFFDIDGAHILLNDYGFNAVTDEFGNAARSVRQAGRLFFNNAEYFNRLVAYRIAWDETKRLGKNMTDFEFRRTLMANAEKFSFSMSRESAAWWQNGLASIPTQFFSYQMRMLELMFLDKTLTAAQRARLWLGQLLLYGSAGVPIGSLVADEIKARTGESPEMNTIAGFFDRGAWDWLIYNLTGLDTQIGARMGTGDFIPNLIRDLMGQGKFGEKSTLDVLGGATFSITKDTFGSIVGMAKAFSAYSAAESGGELGTPILRDAIEKVVRNVTTVDAGYKAYMITQYGMLESRKGTILATDVPPAQAIATILFGSQPSAAYIAENQQKYLERRDKAVNDAVKVFREYRVKMLADPDNMDEYRMQINFYSKTLPPDIRYKALQRLESMTDASFYDSVARRYERERARELQIKGLEQNGSTD